MDLNIFFLYLFQLNKKIIRIFFLLIIIFNLIKKTPNINLFLSYLNIKYEIIRNERYLSLYTNKLRKINKYKKSFTPKISIISPIYNSEKFLLRLLKSIQNQNILDIEIIMVDDFSIDNSVKLIEKYKKEDNRIVLIKNKKNKGTFINRNIGVLFSKGKYIILPDPDDILSKNIINFCYKFAEKYNYEIVRYKLYLGNDKIHLNEIVKVHKNKPIYQPKLSTYIFYGINELEIIDFGLCNKFFKREVYIKAINLLKKAYFNKYLLYSEDSLINYMIYRTAKSFFFLKKIGYYYVHNYVSITNNLFSKSELKIKNELFFLKIIFKFSKNNNYQKDISNLLLNRFLQKRLIDKTFSYNSSIIYYFHNIIKNYLDNKFITNNNKNFLKIYKKIIENIKFKN